MDQTDETRLAREAGDTSVEVWFNLASRVTSRESRRVHGVYLSTVVGTN